MRKTTLFLLILLSTIALVKATRSRTEDDEKDAVAVINKLFDAMRVKDTDGIRALFTAEGQLVATDRRNGDPSRRVFTRDAFAELIAGAQGVLKERMYRPEVRIEGDLALVWGRYGFYVDDRFSHCGTNAFHLMRTAEGWKIVNAASTIETADCEPESKKHR